MRKSQRSSRDSTLSKPLRRRRLLRGIIAAAFGMVWSTAAMVIATQLGWVSYFKQGPLVLGVFFGVLATIVLTLTQMTAKQLRILFVNRVGALIILIALTTPVTLFADTAPALAAQPESECDVSVIGPGLYRGQTPLASALLVTSTTEQNPLVVVPSELTQVEVIWTIDSNQRLEGRPWFIKTNVAGFDHELLRAEGEGDNDTYIVSDFPDGIAPGSYKVWGEFEGICRTQFGYIRVEGSPFDNLAGQVAVATLVVSLIAAVTFARRLRFDLWSMTTADSITVEIEHPETGEVVRGPLIPGEAYHARVSLDLPCPSQAYASIQAPIDVVVGVLGAVTEPNLRRISVNGNEPTSTSAPFEAPTGGDPLELVVDLGISGNPLDSIRIVAEAANPGEMHIRSATGNLLYRSGSLGAQHLASVAFVDSALHLHGDKAGEYLEVWSMSGDSSIRVSERTRVKVSDLQDAAKLYRENLRVAIGTWADIPSEGAPIKAAEPPDNVATLRALASAGSELRRLLLGTGTSGSLFDGTVMVAPDLETTQAMTFPWAGLYQGEVTDDAVLCDHYRTDPSRCDDHGSSVVCPNLFWGFRHELSWPTGWIRSTAGVEDPSFVRRLLGSFKSSRREELLPNRLRNNVPATIATTVAEDVFKYHRLHELQDEFRLSVPRAENTVEFAKMHREGGFEAEIVYFMGHGSRAVRTDVGGKGPVQARDFELKLDRHLDGQALSEALGGKRFTNGPLVIVNACGSGVVALTDHRGFIDALIRNGARAIVVTECDVALSQFGGAANEILRRVLSGTRVARAIVEARRQGLADDGQLSMLAYTYYGPPGLHLTRPPVLEPSIPGPESRTPVPTS